MWNICPRCKEKHQQKHKYCLECHAAYMREYRRRRPDVYRDQHRIRSLVKMRVRRGQIPPATSLYCAACGHPASQYQYWLGFAQKAAGLVLPVCEACREGRAIETLARAARVARIGLSEGLVAQESQSS